MSTTPHPPNEEQRLQALIRLEILDSEEESGFNDLTELARNTCSTPCSAITLIDKDREWHLTHLGFHIKETLRSSAISSHTILQADIFEITDTLESPFRESPLVVGDPNMRSYAGAPLVTSDGHAIGALYVWDRSPKQLTDSQKQALRILAKQVIEKLELRLYIRQQDRIYQQRDRMYATLAHDLRTPFSCVLGYSQLLSEDARNEKLDPDKTQKFSNEILESTLTIYQLLDELLQWSQKRLGTIECQVKPAPVKFIVDQTFDVLKVSLKLKHISFENRVDDEIQVVSDPTLTKTVLRNLIANSIKYTPEQGLISVDAAIKGKTIEIAVQDNGCGIPETVQKTLFTAPTKSSEGSAGEKGTGIGLSLCNYFMSMQGGKIWVDGDFKEGARIIFSLPLAEESN